MQPYLSLIRRHVGGASDARGRAGDNRGATQNSTADGFGKLGYGLGAGVNVQFLINAPHVVFTVDML